jgi:16S rRNA (cytosine1402-N4)-methyltransferase
MIERDCGKGKDAWHVPVMADEVNLLLIRDTTRIILDCTVGCGGHAAAMLRVAPPDAVLVGLDLDEDALGMAKARLSEFGDRVTLKKMNFRDIGTGLPAGIMGKVNALLIDCGISKLQIVKPDRGFSFDRDGDLDMRFDRSASISASSVLSGMDVDELGGLLSQFGEKSRSRRIARAIIKARDGGRLGTTADLATVVKSVVRVRAAKSLARVFLAIRSRVNRELENLSQALDALPQVLASGGRAAVIAYHGTEDRIAKLQFRKSSGRCVCPPGHIVCDCGKHAWFTVLTPRPLTPSAEETKRNPSSRSARIRVVEKM